MQLLAFVFAAAAVVARDGQDVDVAVVSADEGSDVVFDAVRAAVVVAARDRDVGVVDLQAQGVVSAKPCETFACRRNLATRRGAEWHVVVDAEEASDDVDLRLQEGDRALAAVKLHGTRFAQLERVPAAVDELFEQVRPRAEVGRSRSLVSARQLRQRGDLAATAAAYEAAFFAVVDDRAVDVGLGWVRVLDEQGRDADKDAAFDAIAGKVLVDEAAVSPPARARFIESYSDHLWGKAVLLSAIAEADHGPDRASLSSQALAAWQRLTTSSWVNPDVQKRAAEQAARCSIDAVIP